MVKEKIINGNEISRSFNTMMPLDVIADLTRFAKQNAMTGLGKWDYSVALRILLERNTYYEVVSELQDDIISLQAQFNELQHKLNNMNAETKDGTDKSDKSSQSKVKTFGN